MKLSNKLRLFVSLTALLLCLLVGGVSVFAEDMLAMPQETESLSEEDAKSYVDGKINMATIKGYVDQYAGNISQYSECSKEELEYIADMTSSQTDAFVNFAKVAGDGECGTYKDYDNLVVREVEDKDAVEVDADLHFRNKDIRMTLTIDCFDVIGPQVTSTEFSLADKGKETFGDKMKEAASNTLMGMGVVFIVLIFISLIISSFGFIPKFIDKLTKKHEPEVVPSTNESNDIKKSNSIVEKEEDDLELIAVIAAAIAASENTTTDSFVVRSIRRRF